MEPTTYGYSKFVGWGGLLMLVSIVVVLVYMIFHIVILFNDIKILLCFIVLILSVIGFFIYFLIWCFVPMINGAIALELDEEKLQSYITGKTIYWKDVVEISIKIKGRNPFITFEMVDGSNNLDIPTSWIEGNTESIYDEMQEYFAKTL
jgi:hypothetical protein